jgi:hypothetical protein
MPKPRKLRLDDVNIANETEMANWAATTRIVLGQMCWLIIQAGVPPTARAASTNVASRIGSTCPRMRRATLGHMTNPRTSARFWSDGPTITVITSAVRAGQGDEEIDQHDRDDVEPATHIACNQTDRGADQHSDERSAKADDQRSSRAVDHPA